ncbi:MAG: hypothetical protein ACU85E_09565 [Gammaproteobacteria bacterium]
MHELTDRELYQALEYVKSIDEETGKKILIQFEAEHTVLFRMLFNIVPMLIAEQNREMANLFMDLCFDVICVYKKAFGEPPQNSHDPNWLEKQTALLDAELQSLIPGQALDEKIRTKLQERLTKHSDEETCQRGLIKFLYEAIDDFASECPSRVPAIKITQAMILVVVRLFSNLYSRAKH